MPVGRFPWGCLSHPNCLGGLIDNTSYHSTVGIPGARSQDRVQTSLGIPSRPQSPPPDLEQ